MSWSAWVSGTSQAVSTLELHGVGTESGVLSTEELAGIGLGLSVPSESPGLVLSSWHWRNSISDIDGVSANETIISRDDFNFQASRSVLTSAPAETSPVTTTTAAPTTTDTHATWSNIPGNASGIGLSIVGNVALSNYMVDNTGGDVLDGLNLDYNNNGELLIVFVGFRGSTTVSVDYGSDVMVSNGLENNADEVAVEAFSLGNPSKGTNQLSVSLSTARRFSVFVCSISEYDWGDWGDWSGWAYSEISAIIPEIPIIEPLPDRVVHRNILVISDRDDKIVAYPSVAIDKLVQEVMIDPESTRIMFHDENHNMRLSNQQMEKGIRVSDFIESIMPHIIDRIKKEIE